MEPSRPVVRETDPEVVIHHGELNIPSVKSSFVKFFQEMASFVSTKSKDPSTKCGAVIVGPRLDVRGIGFNGICRNVVDDPDLEPDRFDREKSKYLFFEHAERNAIYNCARNGTSTEDCFMFITGLPCADCARAIIQSGIVEVYCQKRSDPAFIERWKKNFDATLTMFDEAGIKVFYYED